MRKVSGVAAAFAALVGFAGAGSAQEKITLRVADSFPAVGHYFAEPGAKYFMQAVTAATNGQVEFQHYPAQQLGKAKDLLALTVSGVADIGSVMPSYAPDKLQLSAVGELPGIFKTSCQGTLAYWNLAKDGILSKAELQPNGVRVLIALVAAPYQALMVQKVQSVKDLEGKKMRTLGSAVDLAMRNLKAIPIRMAAPEIHESLSRGTLDGTLISYGAAVSYSLGPLAKSVTTGRGFGSAVLTYAISEKRWKALPANVQQVMLKVGEDATRRSCEKMDQDTAADLGKLEKQGVSVVSFPADEDKQLETVFASVHKAWADELDGRKRPGGDVLKAYEAAVKAVK